MAKVKVIYREFQYFIFSDIEGSVSNIIGSPFSAKDVSTAKQVQYSYNSRGTHKVQLWVLDCYSNGSSMRWLASEETIYPEPKMAEVNAGDHEDIWLEDQT